MEQTGFTLEGRVLCSDEACIGTIGPDRCCKVCGKPYEGDEPLDGPAPTPDEPAAEAAETVEPAAKSEAAVPEYDPSERECCSDETCIGIIGPDGTCGTCGKPR